MKIVETTFTVSKNGDLKIPAYLLHEMGIVSGDHVRVAYLTDDGMHNTFREFLLTSEGAEFCGEEQKIAIPTHLLHQAQISDNSDIQIICVDGAIVLAREPALNQAELSSVLDSLLSAVGIISELPPDIEQAGKELKDALDYYGEGV